MTVIDQALAEASRLGVDVSGVVVGSELDRVPQAPSHRWVLVPLTGGDIAIGGMDRGSFAPYARFDSPAQVANALARLSSEAPARPLEDAGVSQSNAAEEANRLLRQAGAGDAFAAGSIPAGTYFDHIGTESGHYLYLLGTPMSARSLPPTDLQEPRAGYRLDGPFPDGVRVEVAPSWFGQPGGAVLVKLDRVIAYYCDTGLLQRRSLT